MNRRVLILLFPCLFLLTGCPEWWNRLWGRHATDGLTPEARERAEDLDLAGAIDAQVSGVGSECREHPELSRTPGSVDEPIQPKATAFNPIHSAGENCHLGINEYALIMGLARYLNPEINGGGPQCSQCEFGRPMPYGLLAVNDNDLHHNLLDQEGDERVVRVNQAKTLVDEKYNIGVEGMVREIIDNEAIGRCDININDDLGNRSISMIEFLGLGEVTPENFSGDLNAQQYRNLADGVRVMSSTAGQLSEMTKLNSQQHIGMFEQGQEEFENGTNVIYRCGLDHTSRLSQMLHEDDKRGLFFSDDVIDLFRFTPAIDGEATINTDQPERARPPENLCVDPSTLNS